MTWTIDLGEMKLTREEVISNRKELITLRDAALKQGNMEWAVLLSHSIALAQHLIDLKDGVPHA